MEKGDIDALKKYSFERKNAVYRVCDTHLRHYHREIGLLTRGSSVGSVGQMFS